MEPARLPELLQLVIWKPITMPGRPEQPDIRLDKAAAKLAFDKQTLRDCAAFLIGASDKSLRKTFLPALDETWRIAMAPDDEDERVRYLAQRLAADVLRASGLNP